MCYLRLCLYLFVLYTFGTQAAPNPLDSININLNIKDTGNKAEKSLDSGAANNVYSANENGKTLRSCGDFCDLINTYGYGSMKAKPSTVPYLYLTFDDAPNFGTEHVLDALKEVGVKATFFLVTDKLVDDPNNHVDDPNTLEYYQKVIMRMIDEGHLLADHSYDHMKHNHEHGKSEYVGIEDINYFGKRPIDAVTGVMGRSGFIMEDIVNVMNSMWNYIRLPFTDNWRVGAINSSNDGSCTAVSPDTTDDCIKARNGLSDALGNDGALVFGWDIEWAINWAPNVTRYVYDGETMFQHLTELSSTKTPGKTVMLSHDRAHRPEDNGDLDGKAKLLTFLKLAKEAGFQFRQVDTYLTD